SGARCRHNDNYWRYGDYIGLGPGAHGKRSEAGALLRTERIRSPKRWQRLAGDPASVTVRDVPVRERVFEFMLNALRRIDGFEWREFEARTGCRRETVDAAVRSAREDDLLESGNSTARATGRGLRYLNTLQMRFLAG